MGGPNVVGSASEDQRSVDAVLGGDREAFRGLVERHQAMVVGIAWRFGVRREDVEDLVAEVFVKAFENLRQYRPEHPFGTWLYRLAVNHVIDKRRRARKERGRVEMPEQVADRRPIVGEEIVVDERARLVRLALEDVDSRYREVLSLVYVEGMRVDDTARLLGLPEGTVKTRLMRGREALRRILVRRHPEHFGGRP